MLEKRTSKHCFLTNVYIKQCRAGDSLETDVCVEIFIIWQAFDPLDLECVEREGWGCNFYVRGSFSV